MAAVNAQRLDRPQSISKAYPSFMHWLGVSVFAFLVLLACSDTAGHSESDQRDELTRSEARQILLDANWTEGATSRLLALNFQDFRKEYNDYPDFHAEEMDRYLQLSTDRTTQSVIEAAPECADIFILDDDHGDLAQDLWLAAGRNKTRAWQLCGLFLHFMDDENTTLEDQINLLENAFERQPRLFQSAMRSDSGLVEWLPEVAYLVSAPRRSASDEIFDQLIEEIFLQPMSAEQRAIVLPILLQQAPYLKQRIRADQDFRSDVIGRWRFLWVQFESLPMPDRLVSLSEETQNENVQDSFEDIERESVEQVEPVFTFFLHPGVWDLAGHTERKRLFQILVSNHAGEEHFEMLSLLMILYGNSDFQTANGFDQSQNDRSNFVVIDALPRRAQQRVIAFMLSNDRGNFSAATHLLRRDPAYAAFLARQDIQDERYIECGLSAALAEVSNIDGVLDLSKAKQTLVEFNTYRNNQLQEICFPQDGGLVEFVPGYSFYAIARRNSLGLEPAAGDWFGAGLDVVGFALIPVTGGGSLGLKTLAVGGAKQTIKTGVRSTARRSLSQSIKMSARKRLANKAWLRNATTKQVLAVRNASTSVVRQRGSSALSRGAGARIVTDANGVSWLVEAADKVGYEIVEDTIINAGLSSYLKTEQGRLVLDQAASAAADMRNLLRRIRVHRQYALTPKISEATK